MLQRVETDDLVRTGKPAWRYGGQTRAGRLVAVSYDTTRNR